MVSKLVIPRPNDQIEPLVGNKLTRGWTAPTPPPEPEPVPTAVLDSDVTEVVEDTPLNTADEESAAPKTRPATTARKTAAAKATTGRPCRRARSVRLSSIP